MSRRRKSLPDSIADNLAKQIEEGLLNAGDKLPSIREYAEANRVSKNTVITAFEALTGKGLIEPRRGAGFYVSDLGRIAGPDDEPKALDRAMDIVWLMREQLQSRPEFLNLGEGFPPVEWLKEMRIDQQRVMRTGASSLFRYGSRFGYMPLRQHLRQKLAEYEIEAAAHQIVLTHGANQAMDLIIRYFVRSGDTVVVDDPGYYPLFGKLKLSAANIVGVPRRVDGPDIEVLEELFKNHRPKLFFTQSVAHNPTATDISAAKAHRVLQLAEAHNVIVVENDALADLKSRSATRISALDQLRRTIYLGSFSKSVSAALRVGFIACDADLASDLADVKMLTHVSSSEYCERLLDVALSEGHFLRHTANLQGKLKRATEAGIKLLESLGANIFKQSDQSMYLWASLPGRDDSMEFAKAMLEQKIILAPGAIFSPNADCKSAFSRFNVGYLCDARFADALQRTK